MDYRAREQNRFSKGGLVVPLADDHRGPLIVKIIDVDLNLSSISISLNTSSKHAITNFGELMLPVLLLFLMEFSVSLMKLNGLVVLILRHCYASIVYF